MAFLDEMAAVIAAGTTQAGTGSSFPVWRGDLPDSTVLGDRGVALLLTAGFGDQARATIDNPGLQVLVRGAQVNQVSTAFEEAETVAWAVKNALHEYGGQPESTGHWIAGITNQSGPFFIGKDEMQRPLFSMNMRVMRMRT